MKKLLLYSLTYFLSLSAFENDLVSLDIQLNQLSASLSRYPTFQHWHDACKARNAQEILLALEEFRQALQKFDETIKNLLITSVWLSDKPTADDNLFQVPPLFKSKFPKPIFKPFIEKKIIPVGSTLLFHADFHGDIDALRRYLRRYIQDDFTLNDKNTYMIFLGDYTDRGACGAEVLYTLLRLKQANPHTVFLLRGNHEDITLNLEYGLYDELAEKFGKHEQFVQLLQEIARFYNFLPVALFLGIEQNNSVTYILCCHGGLEIGYDPHPILAWDTREGYAWITALDRFKGLQKLGDFLTNPSNIGAHIPQDLESLQEVLDSMNTLKATNMGFMWSDFAVLPNEPFDFNPHRGFVYSKTITEKMLKSYQGTDAAGRHFQTAGIFRGHQHSQSLNNMMKDILTNKGISKLWRNTINQHKNIWQNIVCTFNVAPEVYGLATELFPGFNYDAYGILKTSTAPFDQWDFVAHQIPYQRSAKT